MANNADIKTTMRAYAVALGDLTWGSGTQYADGTWSNNNRVCVIAKYLEKTTVTRGSIHQDGNPNDLSATDCSLTMATKDLIRGSTGNLKHNYFDYESASKTTTFSRVNEAGFYEKTVIERTCLGIEPNN